MRNAKVREEKKRMSQIERSSAAPSKGSVLSRALLDRKNAISRRDTSFLLLDYSSSMDESLESGSSPSNEPKRRRIDALRNVVRDLRSRNDVRFRTIVFGADVREGEEIPEPCGGTPLARAIEFARQLGATHIAVVSDGQPDNPQDALVEARRSLAKIDVFFVGPEDLPGRHFLAELAKAAGGSFGTSDLGKQANELTEGLARSLKELPPMRESIAL